MDDADYRPVKEIFNSLKEVKARELEPYLEEFDFSKLEKLDRPEQKKILVFRKLPENLAEAGKFMRANLLNGESEKTRNAVYAFRNAIGILDSFEDPIPDEILTGVFFRGPEIGDNMNMIEYQGEKLAVPKGFYFNFKSKFVYPPLAPIPTVGWNTKFPAKDIELNRMYFSQFKK
jgi:hypothetical protein